ncbi:MAG: hypothetical protein R3C25_00990 [Hyphomonadaceae bacterium]
MRLAFVAGVLALMCAVGVAHAQTIAPRGDALIMAACFNGDPARIEPAARAAGGAPAAGQGFADSHAGIERARHRGVWSSTAGWTLGYSEGELAGAPARSCYGEQSSQTVDGLLAEIAGRWPLYAVMRPTASASGRGVRETYAASIQGEDALVIVEWEGPREQAFPSVAVITFPRQSTASAVRAPAL